MYRFLFFILFSIDLQAQVFLNGTITEAKSGLPIPFASVGISGKHYGTLTNESGAFKFKVPYITEKDTIKISAIGYEPMTFTKAELKGFNNNKIISLNPTIVELDEVKVKPKSVKYKVLGTTNYSTGNCTAFMSEEDNWLGSQAAIKAGNKKGQTVYMEDFNFYIIKNTYEDSLKFRLMFYSVSAKGYPAKTFLKKPIIFKTNLKQGVVNVNLREYCITTSDDFFISLECLEKKMDVARFCFSGSIKTPSYGKTSAFNYWKYVKGGGADLNVTVSYLKN